MVRIDLELGIVMNQKINLSNKVKVSHDKNFYLAKLL